MQKSTICVCADEPTEVAAIEAWFSRWREQLIVSENKGCGCCVNLWEVQGPKKAFDELPPQLHSGVQATCAQNRTRSRIKLVIVGIVVLCFVFAKIMSYRN